MQLKEDDAELDLGPAQLLFSREGGEPLKILDQTMDSW